MYAIVYNVYVILMYREACDCGITLYNVSIQFTKEMS